MLKISDYINDVDLRSLNWRRATLERLVKEHKIPNGHCVVFENKVRDRTRMVANLNGEAVLLITPIEEDQTSSYLKTSRFLSKLAGNLNVTKRFADAAKTAQRRLARRAQAKQRKLAARKQAHAVGK